MAMCWLLLWVNFSKQNTHYVGRATPEENLFKHGSKADRKIDKFQDENSIAEISRLSSSFELALELKSFLG